MLQTEKLLIHKFARSIKNNDESYDRWKRNIQKIHNIFFIDLLALLDFWEIQRKLQQNNESKDLYEMR